MVASANASDLFGQHVLGTRLPDLLTPAASDSLTRALAEEEAEPSRVTVGDHAVDLTAHRSDGLVVTEWEPVAGAWDVGASWHSRLPRVLQRLAETQTLPDLTRSLADDVRDLTGFDRVMVYRFDADWNGEVVAEARRGDLEPFLGLHYPASDIPPQARALYTTSWLRLIPDARYTPVPLETAPDLPDGRALDLSGAALRSVSPVHLEYLANMGVVASMSVSLIDDGRLWGLVACHHYAGPHRPSPADRTTAEFLGRTASLLLGTKVGTESHGRVLHVAERQAELVAALGRTPRDPRSALTEGEVTALDLLPAGGAALRLDGRLTLLGSTPPPERVPALVAALLETGTPAVDSLVRVAPDARDVVDVASGMLAVGIGRRGDFLAWFRPEVLHDVSWGGDPTTSKVVHDGGAPRLSPRRSFARWTQTVHATATAWKPHEVAAARSLAEHLHELVLRRADEDNRLASTLQRMLLVGQPPTIPGVALAARYTAAAHDVVGGDWYDVIPLPGDRVAVALGDAAGHGLGAAAVTGQLRHALRAHLLSDLGPAGALESLNGLITSLLPGEMATAVVAELDPRAGVVTIARAGHLPALLLTPDGNRYVDHRGGPALGLLDEVSFPQALQPLGAEDRLLLYSDGLVERRHEDLSRSLDLLRLTARLHPDMDTALEDLLAALDPPSGDDVTVVGFGLSAPRGADTP